MNQKKHLINKRKLTISFWPSLVVSFLCFIGISDLMTRFIKFNETRPGLTLYDPILEVLTPTALDVPIFMLTYFIIIVGVVSSFTSYRNVVIAIQSMAILMLLRMICMNALPLEPPEGIIPLRDPILTHTFYDDQLIVKDLFFSGHTASMVLAILLSRSRQIKVFLIPLAGVVIAMLLIQHVHYTIDVIAALPFAYIGYRCSIFTGHWTMIWNRYLGMSIRHQLE